ncbi:hypothetical protein B0H11DRAFT_1927210 [Mycena galericulata]|nr:hypothetical protein B0H11DRAFT_1927210 [Mycena galericulata]
MATLNPPESSFSVWTQIPYDLPLPFPPCHVCIHRATPPRADLQCEAFFRAAGGFLLLRYAQPIAFFQATDVGVFTRVVRIYSRRNEFDRIERPDSQPNVQFEVRAPYNLGTTNFWDPEVFPADMTGKGEIVQGKNLVDAVKEVGIKFFIWSSLPSATKESNGLYIHVHRLDNKAQIAEYVAASGVPHVVILTAWFAESFSRTTSGASSSPSPEVLGKTYPVVTMSFTYPKLAMAIAKAIGKEVTFTSVESAGLVDLDEMFSFQAKIGMYTTTPIPNPALVALGVQFGTMEEFIGGEVVPRRTHSPDFGSKEEVVTGGEKT